MKTATLRLLLLVFALTALTAPRSGQAADASPPATNPRPSATAGVLAGRVTLSPACPVERMPPDPSCAPRGYQTTVHVYRSTTALLASTTTDAHGGFRFSLPAGTYQIEAQGGVTLPRCTAQTATVGRNATTTVAISCDTGIR